MVKPAEAEQVTQAASSLLFPELEFGIAPNGTYPSEDFLMTQTRFESLQAEQWIEDFTRRI